MPAAPRAFATLVVAAMLLGSAGCGLGIVYNRLDRIVVWFVADMLDLDRQQRGDLRLAAAHLLEWHQGEQLPQYAAFLAEVSQQVGGPITEDDVARWQAELNRWYVELAEASLPIVVVTLRDLREAQIDAFAANMAEYAREVEEETASRGTTELREDWRKATHRAFAERIGRLSGEQRAIIARASRAWQPDAESRARFRRTWQAELIDLLRTRPPVAEFTRELRALWVNAETRYPATLAEAIAHNDALMRSLIVDVLATLSSRQRRHLKRHLSALVTDLEGLAQRD